MRRSHRDKVTRKRLRRLHRDISLALEHMFLGPTQLTPFVPQVLTAEVVLPVTPGTPLAAFVELLPALHAQPPSAVCPERDA